MSGELLTTSKLCTATSLAWILLKGNKDASKTVGNNTFTTFSEKGIGLSTVDVKQKLIV